ncbi:MAG: hypothetical protein R3283_08475 [Balneolaceae bacterium]|nr:hypothetical protein [Balneolaceae bacterium]
MSNAKMIAASTLVIVSLFIVQAEFAYDIRMQSLTGIYQRA